MKICAFITSLFVLILVACTPPPATRPLASQNGIEIYQASVRLPGGTTSGAKSNTAVLAGYIVIKNTGSTNDSLVGVRADFAGMTMFHESSVDSNGVATMNMLAAIDVPAGQIVELKPGGLHIMFVGLKQDIQVGDKVMLTLQFQNAGTIKVQAQVTNQ